MIGVLGCIFLVFGVVSLFFVLRACFLNQLVMSIAIFFVNSCLLMSFVCSMVVQAEVFVEKQIVSEACSKLQ